MDWERESLAPLRVESFAMSTLIQSATALPLTLEDIRLGLSRPALPPEEHDLHTISLKEGTKVTEAAVLVPLVNRPQGVQLLLTQRTAHLRDHAGQISFPGGRVEPYDPDREATALRETEEEIGLARGRIALLGRLPGYEIPSGFRIMPVVGWVEPPFELKPDGFEVADIFEAPLAYFLDPANYQRREYRFRGRHRHYLAIPYEGRYIWGATAGMLYSLCRLLTGK
jgi:8-oxo-dGTP pyrophosphatase MutT (NUDIX family)